MAAPLPPPVSGFVLAGGRSSRMGRDKALLELAGKPLVEHAVTKLRRVAAEVAILGSEPALERYGRLVPDLRSGCGPMGGIEAALASAREDWSLILPVDVPFLPTAFVDWWVRSMLGDESRGARLGMFRTWEIPQPTFLMIHRELRPYLSDSIARGQYKLTPVLEAAARDLAVKRGVEVWKIYRNLPWDEHAVFADRPYPGVGWWQVTEAQRRNQLRWFANLNTPDEFAEGEMFADALDT